MFALGLMSWLYTRPTEGTVEFIAKKFAKRPEIVEANRRLADTDHEYGYDGYEEPTEPEFDPYGTAFDLALARADPAELAELAS